MSRGLTAPAPCYLGHWPVRRRPLTPSPAPSGAFSWALGLCLALVLLPSGALPVCPLGPSSVCALPAALPRPLPADFPYLAYTSARVHLRGFPSLGFVDLSFGAPAVLPRRPWLPASCLFSRTFPRPFLWVSWISLLALLLALRVSPLRLQLVSFPFLVSCMACPFLFLFLLTL